MPVAGRETQVGGPPPRIAWRSRKYNRGSFPGWYFELSLALSSQSKLLPKLKTARGQGLCAQTSPLIFASPHLELSSGLAPGSQAVTGLVLPHEPIQPNPGSGEGVAPRLKELLGCQKRGGQCLSTLQRPWELGGFPGRSSELFWRLPKSAVPKGGSFEISADRVP